MAYLEVLSRYSPKEIEENNEKHADRISGVSFNTTVIGNILLSVERFIKIHCIKFTYKVVIINQL